MKTKYRNNRSGTALICVLVCGLIAISLGTSAVRLTLVSARASKQTLRLRQAQWLLEAGIERSQLRISNGDFADEEWKVPAGVLSEDHASVSINVADAGNDSMLVTVSVEYGPEPGSERNIRRTYAYRQPRISEQDPDGAG